MHLNISTRTRQFRSELSQIWLFEIGSTGCYSSYGKTEFWLGPHSYQSFHLMHQIFPKAKMRSRFMILCQPPLNGITFIFPPPLIYKPSPSFIPKDIKTPSLLLSWVLGSWVVLSYLGLPETQDIEWDLFFPS